jgi:hypothetical protein
MNQPTDPAATVIQAQLDPYPEQTGPTLSYRAVWPRTTSKTGGRRLVKPIGTPDPANDVWILNTDEPPLSCNLHPPFLKHLEHPPICTRGEATLWCRGRRLCTSTLNSMFVFLPRKKIMAPAATHSPATKYPGNELYVCSRWWQKQARPPRTEWVASPTPALAG